MDLFVCSVTGEAAATELCGPSDRVHAVGNGTGGIETSRVRVGSTLWVQQPFSDAHGHPAPGKSSGNFY